MEDLTKKMKVGDTVYMPLKISKIDHAMGYPVVCKTNGGNELAFSAEGFYTSASKKPDLLLSVSQYPKVMEVSNGINWAKRVVIAENTRGFIAYKHATTIEVANQETEAVFWLYAREIQTPERVKLTIQDIADKLGVDAGLIDIIK